MSVETTERPITVAVHPGRWVFKKIAAAAKGYTVRAIERKIEDGVWLEGEQWIKAPDGHVLVSLEGIDRWVERGYRR